PSARTERELLVQRAQDLVDRRRGPEVEERRALEQDELALAPLLGLLGALARPGRLLLPADQVLVVDGRVLDVAVELREVAGVQTRPARGAAPPPPFFSFMNSSIRSWWASGAAAGSGRRWPRILAPSRLKMRISSPPASARRARAGRSRRQSEDQSSEMTRM